VGDEAQAARRSFEAPGGEDPGAAVAHELREPVQEVVLSAVAQVDPCERSEDGRPRERGGDAFEQTPVVAWEGTAVRPAPTLGVPRPPQVRLAPGIALEPQGFPVALDRSPKTRVRSREHDLRGGRLQHPQGPRNERDRGRLVRELEVPHQQAITAVEPSRRTAGSQHSIARRDDAVAWQRETREGKASLQAEAAGGVSGSKTWPQSAQCPSPSVGRSTV